MNIYVYTWIFKSVYTHIAVLEEHQCCPLLACTPVFMCLHIRRWLHALHACAPAQVGLGAHHVRGRLPHEPCVLDVQFHIVLVSEVEEHGRIRPLCAPKADKEAACTVCVCVCV